MFLAEPAVGKGKGLGNWRLCKSTKEKCSTKYYATV